MSSCDSFMIASSALFTENLYKPLRPDRPDRHYLRVGRAVSLAVVAAGVCIAFLLPTVVHGLEWFWKISPTIGIAFWLGLFWRRTTTAGAWAATLVGFAVLLVISYGTGLMEVLQGTWVDGKLGLIRTGDAGEAVMYLPWQMVFYLSAGTVAGVAVSLLTRPVPKAQLDHYYALTRTPVVPGEEVEEPCTLPAGVAPAPRRVLLGWGGLEILVPTWTSVIGFAAAWVLVGAMIAGFYWLTQ
jgi:Na+/proline symporter